MKSDDVGLPAALDELKLSWFNLLLLCTSRTHNYEVTSDTEARIWSTAAGVSLLFSG